MAKNKRQKSAPVKQDVKRNIATDLVEKTVFLTRQDIAHWRRAWQSAINVENPTRWQLINLYETHVEPDAIITSQIENRMQATLGTDFNITKPDGEKDEELTKELKNSKLFSQIIEAILSTRFKGHLLTQFKYENDKLILQELPRTNVLPVKGIFLNDYSEEKGIPYRELPDFGTWILEFGDPKDLGLFNKAVPHVLFKKFAQSCWSELCEIYGIPPRVMKTDTQDPRALQRGKKMMQEMGAAAWFIIDTNENFEWAKGVDTNGDVYNNLINLCDNQNSMLIQGAIIGQDTKHGSYGKDDSSQKMLEALVIADMSMVEMEMQDNVMPALARIGIVPEGYRFEFEMKEDLDGLWTKVKDSLPFFEVDPEWCKEKFGIEITGKRENQNLLNPNFGIGDGFFV